MALPSRVSIDSDDRLRMARARGDLKACQREIDEAARHHFSRSP
jgi:hypothetical protein